MSVRIPLVGIPACRKFIDPHPYHAVGEKYVSAVASATGCIPVLVPPLGRATELDALLERLDGLLLTGSPSNVEPHHYEGTPSDPGTLHDPHRDATTLPLIRTTVAAGLPLFAICRGCQEMNVAYGGTLHQKVHEVPGLLDHREDTSRPLEEQYGPSHELTLTPGGLLSQVAGGDTTVRVNSLHGQGIERLGDGLEVEARAPDGLVEAFRVVGAPAFALAVQWHPEWRVLDNTFSRALFEAFGDACRARAGTPSAHERYRRVV